MMITSEEEIRRLLKATQPVPGEADRRILANAFGPVPVPEIHACCTIDRRHTHIPPGVGVEEAISMNGKLWTPGETIGIRFLDGSNVQRSKAQRWIEYWNQVANLHFDFAASDPDVRITFTPGGSWSMLGTDCRQVRGQATIQFGWVTDSSTEESDRAVIVHEAGHMLGLGHEQSNPLEDIAWNKPAALAYYMSTQGWTAQMVNDNVFEVFDPSIIHGTAYDRTSIMQYPVPAQLTLDGRGIAWNTDLSPLDRSYVGTLYPFAATPPPVPPPVTPPVQPPAPAHPVVGIGKPAVHQHIPAVGQPALFSLSVPSDMILSLSAQMQPSFGREPILYVQRSQETPLKLGLVHGKGLFRFQAGQYTVSVYNPIPRLTGVAWLKVGVGQ